MSVTWTKYKPHVEITCGEFFKDSAPPAISRTTAPGSTAQAPLSSLKPLQMVPTCSLCGNPWIWTPMHCFSSSCPLLKSLGNTSAFKWLFIWTLVVKLPRWLRGYESTCQHRECKRRGFHPRVGKGRKWQPTPVFLPGEFHGQRSLAGCSPCDCKQLDMTEWIAHTTKESGHLEYAASVTTEAK